MTEEIPPPKLRTRAFVWSVLKPHVRWISLSIFLGSLSAAIQVGLSKYVQTFIDVGLLAKDREKVILLGVALTFIIFLDGSLDFFHRFLMRMSVERTVRDLRKKVFERMLILSERASTKISSGKALTHIISDVFSFGIGLNQAMDVVREPLVIIFLVAYMFTLNVQLTLFCFLAIGIVPLVGAKLAQSARRNHVRYQEAVERISAHTIESARGRRTALAFGRQKELLEEFVAKIQQSYHYQIRLARTEEVVNPVTKWVTSLVGAVLIVFAGLLVLKGQMTIGGLTAFLLSAGRLQGPLKLLNQSNVRMQQFVATGARLNEFLSQPLDGISQAQASYLVPNGKKLSDLARPQFTELEFKNVTFTYPARENETDLGIRAPDQALAGVSLTLKKGEKIALVGKSGSGKSTLSLLAMRLMDPDSGQILLNSRNLKDWDLMELRNFFSYVSQEVFLFQRSLRENFLFAQSNASDTEIFAALEKAAIADFVRKLPRGLDTQIGEMGSTLSGGEKQRFAIARAFLRDAPLLILDEATSQLDSFSEATVQKSLKSLMLDRSVLLIAHRLSTVKEADQVLVMDHGKILERGHPTELLSDQRSVFSHLWRTQFQEQQALT